jgi:hypothetical protein
MPGIALDCNRGRWVGLEIVVPGRVFYASEVGRDEGQTVGVRDSVQCDGAGFARLGAHSGEDDRGTPVAIPAKLLLPPVSLVMSWSRRFAVGRRSAAPAFVAAKLRIARWNVLAS